MTFSGSFIDSQPLSDFSIRQTLTDQVRHLPLPLGQGWSGGLAQRRKTEESADLADERIDITDVGEM